MTDAYVSWIAAYQARLGDAILGKCAEATTAMVAAFPELRRVAGHAFTDWGRRAHWWCVSPDGTVLDPTAVQFPAGMVYEYEEWSPGALVLVGKCMDCGKQIWRPTTSLAEEPRREEFCGPACHDSYAAYLSQPLGSE